MSEPQPGADHVLIPNQTGIIIAGGVICTALGGLTVLSALVPGISDEAPPVGITILGVIFFAARSGFVSGADLDSPQALDRSRRVPAALCRPEVPGRTVAAQLAGSRRGRNPRWAAPVDVDRHSYQASPARAARALYRRPRSSARVPFAACERRGCRAGHLCHAVWRHAEAGAATGCAPASTGRATLSAAAR